MDNVQPKEKWQSPPVSPCYLCGRPFEEGEDWNKDHVPPKQFFSHYVRQKFQNMNLEWLPTHPKCNSGYQPDEDYFVHSLTPLAIKTPMARSVFDDNVSRYQQGNFLGLRQKIMEEFSEFHPISGLIIPGKIFKNFDTPRLSRITWKLIRGLFFQKHLTVLPEATARDIQYTQPGDSIPDLANALFGKEDKSEGKNPGVFNYRTHIVSKNILRSEYDLHYWYLVLWDAMSIQIGFIPGQTNPNLERKDQSTL